MFAQTRNVLGPKARREIRGDPPPQEKKVVATSHPRLCVVVLWGSLALRHAELARSRGPCGGPTRSCFETSPIAKTSPRRLRWNWGRESGSRSQRPTSSNKQMSIFTFRRQGNFLNFQRNPSQKRRPTGAECAFSSGPKNHGGLADGMGPCRSIDPRPNNWSMWRSSTKIKRLARSAVGPRRWEM